MADQITIHRAEAYAGTVPAEIGLRVSVPIKGDRQGYKCYERFVTGTIEAITQPYMTQLKVRLDEPAPYVGEYVQVFPWDAKAI